MDIGLPCWVRASARVRNVNEITRLNNQLNAVAIEKHVERHHSGNSSLFTVHGIGPMPKKGNKASLLASERFCGLLYRIIQFNISLA